MRKMHGQEDYLYSRKDRAISYCDPEKKYDDKYGGKKFYHIYEDCEWLSRNDKIKMLYRYEAYAEGYTLLCKKCSERLNRKAEED